MAGVSSAIRLIATTYAVFGVWEFDKLMSLTYQ